MDILLIDEKIKIKLNNVEKRFYFFDTSYYINTYKKILSKPILHSDETTEKSDIIEEYLKIVKISYIDILSKSELDSILYYYPDYNTRTCNACGGTKFIQDENFITCNECFCFTIRILNISSPSDINRVKPRKVYKKRKMIYNKSSYNKYGY